MRVSDLLETRVVDTNGRSLGQVRDVDLIQDGPLRSSGQAALRVHGLITGRFAIATRLGYTTREGIAENRETPTGPLPICALVRWLQTRREPYIRWEDILAIEDDKITVSC